MIIADIGELEKLSSMLISISSETDDVLQRLRKMSSEIQSDLDLQTYPQYPLVTEAVSLGVDALNRGNDTLQSLKNVLLYVATEYESNEKKHKNALARMTTILSGINVNLTAATTPADTASVERDEQTDTHEQVVSLVSDSALEMQMANIAAITKKADGEYGIEKVEAMADTPEGD